MAACLTLCFCAAFIMHKSQCHTWVHCGAALSLNSDWVHWSGHHLEIQRSHYISLTTVLTALQKYAVKHFFSLIFCLHSGKDITAQSPDSTKVKKDGLYLTISPVTAAHEGEYMCLVKDTDMEMIRTYQITVDGEEHRFSSFILSCIFSNFV